MLNEYKLDDDSAYRNVRNRRTIRTNNFQRLLCSEMIIPLVKRDILPR